VIQFYDGRGGRNDIMNRGWLSTKIKRGSAVASFCFFYYTLHHISFILIGVEPCINNKLSVFWRVIRNSDKG
jgi:hypothetical protein